ncbi:MAG: response regulator [Lewinellaceae bacterium]|nr:response regulator [Phaeodactylibacter sp.]MCB9037682.1 response regulator [Lewinellaceae bacterium]
MANLKKILICEDEEILLTALKFRLQKQGYELFLAVDGKEARDIIQKERPDLIVTDIDVPKISGMELISLVRNDMEMNVPIIIIAPLENENLILEAMQKGADDFVTKPFKPVELVLRIRRIFQDIASRVG